MPNWDAIEKTLLTIEDHPEEFDMRNWAKEHYLHYPNGCKTSACFAGWACIVAGDKLLFTRWGIAEYCETIDGEKFTIYGRARTLLGITDDEANHLFYATDVRSPEHLRQVVRETLGTPDGK